MDYLAIVASVDYRVILDFLEPILELLVSLVSAVFLDILDFVD